MSVWLDHLNAEGTLVETLVDKFVAEASGTFALVLTVCIGLASRSPIAALAIGAILMASIYTAGHRVRAHFNPAITLAATLWGRISFRDATASWLAQLAGGLCAATATRLTVGALQFDTLSGRTLVAAFAGELLFAFVLAYVVISCVESRRYTPDSLSHFAVGIAVVAGAVDFAALFGAGYLVSQLIVGAFTAFAFLTFGSGTNVIA